MNGTYQKEYLFPRFLIAASFVLASLVSANGQTNMRSIEEFVEAQGTYCVDDGMGGCFVADPPVANFIGWFDPDNGHTMLVDYAGVLNRALVNESAGTISYPPEFSGSVTEHPLKDGRAEVNVTLHTKNAVINTTSEFGEGPILFGHDFPEILGGAEPALGHSLLKATFTISEPGAPLPDLVNALFFPEPGQEFTRVSFRAQGDGPLREAFGVPDGTPGKSTTSQTGIFDASGQGALADGFPVEFVKLQQVGSGVSNVPEPSSMLLSLICIVGLVVSCRR